MLRYAVFRGNKVTEHFQYFQSEGAAPLALSRSPKRPRQFLLHMLYWQEFEDLVRALGLRLFGAGLTSFKTGKDGGRDARFEGIPDAWPSKATGAQGKYVLQSKHTGGAQACCSDNDFKSHMKGEAKKVKKLIGDQELSHYVVFTNRTKTAAEDEAFRTSFGKIKGMSEAWLVGTEHLHGLLSPMPR
jgi:hypothetical protein